MIELNIHPTLRDAMPQLLEDEYSILEASIIEDGVREPIEYAVWPAGDEDVGKPWRIGEKCSAIWDGHNRFNICTEHGIEFRVNETEFDSFDDVMLAIYRNQLGRRNLSESQRAMVAGRMANLRRGGDRRSDEFRVQICTLNEAADAAGVSRRTAANARAVLDHGDESLVRAVDAGQIAVSRAEKISRLPVEEQREVVKNSWSPVLMSVTPEWYTPAKYLNAVRCVMQTIDLDPASCEAASGTVGAATYYTKEDDGLSMDWAGRVFLNPPYGADGPPFIARLVEEIRAGNVTEAIILVNSRATDSGWFQPLFDGVICFTDHRIDFDSPGNKATSSTHGSCFIYFGPNEKEFAEAFSEFGNVVKRWS